MKTIEFKGKSYEIVESMGELPARKTMKLFQYFADVQENKIDLTDFNFLFVSLILDVPMEVLEKETNGTEFIKVLNELTAILGRTIQPNLKEEFEAPSAE